MAVTRQKKEEILQKLEDKFSRAKAVYFAEYRGVPVKDVTELRKEMVKSGIDYVVAKKTLMMLAAKNQNLPEITKEMLTGPVVAVFSYDDLIKPSKMIVDFAKNHEGVKLIGALLEGKMLDAKGANAMAKLPSKEELLSKLVGSMQAPISGFHGTMHGLLSKFIRTLDAVKAKKG